MIKLTLKHLFVLLLLFTISNTLVAQNDSSESKTQNKFLFRSEKIDLTTFYAEFTPVSLSQINGIVEGTSIFSAGLILNKKFFFGFFSESSPNLNKIGVPISGSTQYQDWLNAGVDLDQIPTGTDSIFVTYQQSGFHFGYLHQTNKTIFWRAGLKLGLIGGVKLSEDKTFLGLFDNPIYKTKVITLTPEVGVGVNLLPWLRANADIGYRLLATNKINNKVVNGEAYNSMTFRLGFSFGAFNKN